MSVWTQSLIKLYIERRKMKETCSKWGWSSGSKCTHHSSYNIFKTWQPVAQTEADNGPSYRSGGWRFQSWLTAAIRILSNQQDHCYPTTTTTTSHYINLSLSICFFLTISFLSVYLFLPCTRLFLALSQLDVHYITLMYFITPLSPLPPTHIHSTHTL